MGTSCTIGFAHKKDYEDYQGIYVHYDGYPDHIIPVIAFCIHYKGFSQFVSEIKNNYSVRGINLISEVLESGKLIDDKNKFAEKKKVGREDLYQYSYAYVINSPDKIKQLPKSDKPGFIHNLKEIDWEIVERSTFSGLFENRKHLSMHQIDSIIEETIKNQSNPKSFTAKRT